MLDIYKKCDLCMHKCNIDRTNNKGFCNATDKVLIARSAPHYWEEPCISGTNGSGAVFFSHCNMKCLFCQNRKISLEGFGTEVSIEKLSNLYLELQQKKVHNINLVTPTHYVPSIIESLKVAKKNGLNIPIVYNTGNYENVDTIKKLDGYVDIYLPDFKYYDDELAIKFSNSPNYFEVAKNNIEEMYKQINKISFDKNGLMTKGIIVRILILPGHIDDSKKIIEYLYSKYKNNIFYSIMNQYTPVNRIDKYEELNRKVSDDEYDEVIDFAYDLGIRNAFIQEGETQKESFIPEFNGV